MDVRFSHACRASDLSRRLSDTELFLLIESAGFAKSSAQRMFPASAFYSVSIRKRVDANPQQARRLIDKAVQGLVKKGFLSPVPPDSVHATKDGDLVKHCFSDLRNALVLSGPEYDTDARSVRFCVALRKEMKRICKAK